jgi:hypothetical protein
MAHICGVLPRIQTDCVTNVLEVNGKLPHVRAARWKSAEHNIQLRYESLSFVRPCDCGQGLCSHASRFARSVAVALVTLDQS